MNNESKHTSGHWQINEGQTFKTSTGRLILMVESTLNKTHDVGTVIAKVFGNSNDEVIANAKLIAAAPELLEALKAISEWDKRHEAIIGTVIINQVNSAIKKATE